MTVPSFLRHPRLAPLHGRGSLRAQLVWLTVVASAVVVAALGALVQLLLSTTTANTVGRVLNDRAETVASSVIQASAGRAILVPQARLDADVAVYDAAGGVVAGAVPEALKDEYRRLRTVRSARTLSVGDHARVHALGFVTPRGARGTVVVSERLAPYQETAEVALSVTIGAGALLVAGSAVLVALASRRVLAPVGAMARTADEWSERDLGRRFGLTGPGNEITALGHTLDGLLDKVASTIRSEQRLTSELAHELRTPLTAVQGNAELLLMNPSLDEQARLDAEEIMAGCRRMTSTISGLIDLARSTSSAASTALTSPQEVVEEVLAELDLAAAHPDLDVQVDVAGPEAWTVPRDLGARALAPVMSNAARFARSTVRVSLDRSRPGALGVVVEDDGPGVDADDRDRIFRPGETTGDGAGLGLALSRRIARTSGGDVSLDERSGTTAFRLTLPSTRPDRAT